MRLSGGQESEMATKLSAKRRIDFGAEPDKEKAEGLKKGVEDIMNTMRPLKRKGAADDDDEQEGRKGRRSSGSGSARTPKEETEAGS